MENSQIPLNLGAHFDDDEKVSVYKEVLSNVEV